MDIKSKKKGWAGKALTAGILLVLVLLEMALYPVYRTRAQSYAQPVYETEDFVYRAQQAAYGLYWQGVSETVEGEYLPSELYRPAFEDVLSEETFAETENAGDEGGDPALKALLYCPEDIDSSIINWAENQDYWLGDMSYQLILKKSAQLYPGGEETIEAGSIAQDADIRALLQGGGEIDDYQYVLRLEFDEAGLISGAETVYSADGASASAEALWEPVIQASAEIKKIKGPANADFYLAVKKPALVQADSQSYYGRFLRDSNRRNMGYAGDILAYYAGILAAAALGLVLALKKPSKGFLHQLPFEVAAPLLCVCLAAMPLMHETITETLFSGAQNRVAETLHLEAATVDVLLWLLNAGAWAALLCLTFLTVRALAQVFRAGIKNYLYCRCLLIRFCRWIGKKVKQGWNWLSSVDLSDKGKQKLILLLCLNFLVTVFFCVIWLPGLPGLLVYHALILWLLLRQYRRYQKNYQTILDSVKEMANGNLSAQPAEEAGVFEPLREQLGAVRAGFRQAVEEEVKSQNMKTELISNVSHDLKTPLTAIITYVDLLKDTSLTEEERTEYIETLDKKSQRLKHLIEDLFEVSKAASGNVTMKIENVDLCALMKQIQYELSDQLEASGVQYRWDIPDKRIALMLDGQKTCRIFENLLINISKYGMPDTRAYISVAEQGDWAVVTMKNVSASELDFDPAEITERFARGDKARHTEGSGLGLAIVRSFTELQGGRFSIAVDGDLFKAEVRFPLQGGGGREKEMKVPDGI